MKLGIYINEWFGDANCTMYTNAIYPNDWWCWASCSCSIWPKLCRASTHREKEKKWWLIETLPFAHTSRRRCSYTHTLHRATATNFIKSCSRLVNVSESDSRQNLICQFEHTKMPIYYASEYFSRWQNSRECMNFGPENIAQLSAFKIRQQYHSKTLTRSDALTKTLGTFFGCHWRWRMVPLASLPLQTCFVLLLAQPTQPALMNKTQCKHITRVHVAYARITPHRREAFQLIPTLQAYK